MKTSIHIKSILAKLFYITKLTDNRIINKAARNYLILMYHRILPYSETEQCIQDGMYVEPETFNMHINYLKNYFNIIPLSILLSQIKDISSIKNDPICVLTFDDGWYDFYKFAFPILSAQKAPATVFLPTKYIGTENRFWTDEVANYIIQNNKNINMIDKNRTTTNILINKLESLKGPTMIKIEKAISLLKTYKDDEIFSVLAILKNNSTNESKISERSFINWEEARKMAESGLITFGSHTNNHKMLTFLDDNDIYEELIQSKNKLLSEKIVSQSFIPFSYPNGNYDKRVIKILKETGYHIGVTTENGWNPPITPNYLLKRVGIHQDMSSTKEMFGCRIANIF